MYALPCREELEDIIKKIKTAEMLIEHGNDCSRQGEYEVAIQYFRAAYFKRKDEGKEYPLAWDRLAYALRKLGENSEAAKCAMEAMRIKMGWAR